MIRRRVKIVFTLLITVVVVLFVIDMTTGAVGIPLRSVIAAFTGGDCSESIRKIVIHIRLVKAVVAVIAGAALAVSGQQMQTLFRNPLAGPYVLGISSGASLGVALFVLGAPLLGRIVVPQSIGMAGAAWIGAGLVLALIVLASRRINDIMVILILGIMFSSGVSAIVQIFQYMSRDESLKAFVIWTMGSLGETSASQLPMFGGAVVVGLILAVVCIKPLDLLLFGNDYARTMGLDLRRTNTMLFMSTTLLAGTVTAFCGPIGFIGLAIPHVTAMLFKERTHRILIPGNILAGAAVLLLCDIVSKYFTIPVNSVTALFGIPVVVWVVLRNR